MRHLIAGLSAGIGAIGMSAALLARRRFNHRIDVLDQQLVDAQTDVGERSDLPTAIAELAKRMGAGGAHPARFVDIRQTGTMWFKPAGGPQHFSARQRIGSSSTGFVWRAAIGPLGLGGLQPGEWRELTAAELDLLRKISGAARRF